LPHSKKKNFQRLLTIFRNSFLESEISKFCLQVVNTSKHQNPFLTLSQEAAKGCHKNTYKQLLNLT